MQPLVAGTVSRIAAAFRKQFSHGLDRDGSFRVSRAEQLEPRIVFTNYVWKNPVSGAWSNPNNWNPTGVPTIGHTASITLPGTYTVTLPNANVTVDSLTLGNTGAGKQKLQMPVNGNLLLKTDALTINNTAVAGGSLDLNDNDAMIDYPTSSVIAALTAKIVDGWTALGGLGFGITSSAAETDGRTMLGIIESDDLYLFRGQFQVPPYSVPEIWNGQSIDYSTDAVLIKYTYFGDANFDGQVDYDDYSLSGAGYNLGKSGWYNGDFDLNGQNDFDDFVLIDVGFNSQTGVL